MNIVCKNWLMGQADSNAHLGEEEADIEGKCCRVCVVMCAVCTGCCCVMLFEGEMR